MATYSIDYNLNKTKEVVVNYDKDKKFLDDLIGSGQVQPLEENVLVVSKIPAEAVQVGPSFRFESKIRLTQEDALKIAQGYVHRRASCYTMNLDGRVATLTSFADSEKIRLVHLPNNNITFYV